MADTALVPSNNSGALAMTPAALAQLEKDRRAFVANMQKVTGVDKATQRVSASQFTLPIFVFGHSKIGEDKYPKMIYVLMPDFRDFKRVIRNMPEVDSQTGEIEVEVDARSKAKRESDEKAKPPIDMDKEPVYEQDAVSGTLDPLGKVRRIRVHFAPNTLMSLRNEAALNAFKAGMFAIVNVEASAWHDDAGIISVVPKITGLVDTVQFPEALFVEWIYSKGLWTKNFKTKVRYYCDFMAKLEKMSADDRAKIDTAGARYRNDNQFLIPIGFEDRLLTQFANPRGCHIRDITDVTKEANLVDTRKGTVRYFANYHGRQWRTTATGGRVELDFTLDLAFFSDHMERLGVSSLSTWKTLWPAIRPYYKVLVMGCEDAERTLKTRLTMERVFLSDDPEYMNQPAGKDQISFVLSVNQRGVVFDPAAMIQSISIPVSADTIRDFFWNGHDQPPNVPADSKTLQTVDPRIVNLSESRDKRREFDNKDFTLHLLVNVTMLDSEGNAQPLTTLGNLSLEEGNRLARYLSACVLNGGANIPKQEYLDNLGDSNPEERAKITPKSIINRYIFNPPATPIVYVFAINRAQIDEDLRIFKQKITRLNLLSVFMGDGATLALPSTAASAAKATTQNVHVEEVTNEAERAKSPPRGRKRKDENSEASSDGESGRRSKRQKKEPVKTQPKLDRMEEEDEVHNGEDEEENGAVFL